MPSTFLFHYFIFWGIVETNCDNVQSFKMGWRGTAIFLLTHMASICVYLFQCMYVSIGSSFPCLSSNIRLKATFILIRVPDNCQLTGCFVVQQNMKKKKKKLIINKNGGLYLCSRHSLTKSSKPYNKKTLKCLTSSP